MDFIVVYDKKTSGNPIVAIHSQRFHKDTVELKDIHPEDDPNEQGVVIVPGEIINQMVIRKYKRDREGKIVQKPLLQERTKGLTSMPDTALGQSILVFGEPITEIISITGLDGQSIEGTIVKGEKGIIGIGSNAGLFTVICCVDTGIIQPEIISEKQNWKWKRDDDGNIIGMELVEEIASETELKQI